MMNAIAKPDARDWTSLPYDSRDYVKKLGKGVKGLKIAFSPTLGYAEVDPEIARAVKKAVKVLADLGAVVKQVDPGFADPARAFARCGGRARGRCSANCRTRRRRCSIRRWPMLSRSRWRSRRRIISRRCASAGFGHADARVHGEL